MNLSFLSPIITKAKQEKLFMAESNDYCKSIVILPLAIAVLGVYLMKQENNLS
jgi:hypothetical protein